MTFDGRFTRPDTEDGQVIVSEYFVIDTAGMSLRHVFEVASNLKTVKWYSKYSQEALPLVIKQMHFVNCSSIFNRMFSLMKKFMNKTVQESTHVHTGGFESLHEFIPKSILPEEFGGEAGSMNDMHIEFMKFLETKR